MKCIEPSQKTFPFYLHSTIIIAKQNLHENVWSCFKNLIMYQLMLLPVVPVQTSIWLGVSGVLSHRQLASVCLLVTLPAHSAF